MRTKGIGPNNLGVDVKAVVEMRSAAKQVTKTVKENGTMAGYMAPRNAIAAVKGAAETFSNAASNAASNVEGSMSKRAQKASKKSPGRSFMNVGPYGYFKDLYNKL